MTRAEGYSESTFSAAAPLTARRETSNGNRRSSVRVQQGREAERAGGTVPQGGASGLKSGRGRGRAGAKLRAEGAGPGRALGALAAGVERGTEHVTGQAGTSQASP